MNPNLKILLSTAGAAVMAVTLAASASAQPKHQVHRPAAALHQMSECADPGSHVWCAPAPSHINDAAEAAGT
jgi:hypothetical protein